MRESPLFAEPKPVDLLGLVAQPTPEPWRPFLAAANVSLLPLVDGARAHGMPGWTNYTDGWDELPEVEVFCGGLNEKEPACAAIWRQGDLLHFGFEPAPSELNGRGRQLLENSIRYIARFRDDRPIARTKSVFVGGKVPPQPARLAKYLARIEEKNLASELASFRARWFAPKLAAECEGLDRAGLLARLAAMTPRLTVEAGSDGELRLAVDGCAAQWHLAIDDVAILDQAVAALGSADPKAATRAAAFLARNVPDGPKSGAPAAEWASWIAARHDQLFFSRFGGYRWYVDELARSRGVATRALRGTKRASAP